MTERTLGREQAIYRVTWIGFAVNLVLSAGKLAAGIWGHSAAMVADAIHSVSDFATDLVVLLFVRVSAKPRDDDHDYGHGKYETLATLIIGVALAGALPMVEAPGCLGGAQGRDPQVGDVVEVGLDGGHLVVGDDEGDRCGGLPVSGEDAGPGGGIVARGIGENGAGLGGERLFGLVTAREMVRKAWLRLRIFDNACDLVGQAHEVESHRAMVHGARPLELLNVSLP